MKFGKEGIMAKEALNAVLQVEDEAKQIVNAAKEEARIIEERAQENAQERYRDILQLAEDQAEDIKRKAEHQANMDAKPVLANGDDERQSLLQVDPEKRQRAKNFLVERIVNQDGNR